MLAGSKILMLLDFAARIVKFQRVNFKFGRIWALFVTKRGVKFYALILLRKIYRMKFHYAKPFARALRGSQYAIEPSLDVANSRSPRAASPRKSAARFIARNFARSYLFRSLLFPAEKQQICHYDHDRDGRYEAQRKVPNFKSQLAHIGAKKPA